MKALLVSDAHLADPADAPYTALIDLLRQAMTEVDALVILGDFFDLWLGDNRYIASPHASLLGLVRQYRDHGKSIFYLKGNHDFMLGKIWEEEIGARLFDEEATFAWDGYRFFASHGEHIDKKDYGYRAIRKILRSPAAESAIRWMGEEWIYRLSLRFASAARGRPTAKKVREQNRSFFRYAKSKIESGYHAVILGHTHSAQWHVLSFQGVPCLYVNPGSWSDQRTFLWYQSGRFQLRKYLSSERSENLFDFTLPLA